MKMEIARSIFELIKKLNMVNELLDDIKQFEEKREMLSMPMFRFDIEARTKGYEADLGLYIGNPMLDDLKNEIMTISISFLQKKKAELENELEGIE